MTYEEAINQLNSVVIYHEAKCTRKSLDIAIKCIEKQIPKKPINVIYDCQYVEYWNCPHCHIQHSNEIALFCDNCGQAIDIAK